MKNITIKLATTEQASKALIQLGEAFNQIPEIKMHETSLQKYIKEMCLFASINAVADEVMYEMHLILTKITYRL